MPAPSSSFVPALGRAAAVRARGYGPGGEEDVGPPAALLDFVAAAEAARMQVRGKRKGEGKGAPASASAF